MRFYQFNKPLAEEIISEVKMSPKSLKAFLNSPAAEGMQAGFEAELVFRGIADTEGDEIEPDFDANESAHSFDDIRDFFTGGDGVNSSRQVNQLIEQINDGYLDWFLEKESEWVEGELQERMDQAFDEWFKDQEEDLVQTELDSEYDSEEVDKILTAGIYSYVGTVKEKFKDQEEYEHFKEIYEKYRIGAAEQAREEFDRDHEDEIRDELRDEYDGEDADLADYLDEEYGGNDMATIYYQVGGVDWPYYTGYGDDGDGYSIDSAESLASSLSNTIDMPARASGGYHSARREPNLWIIEPDSSLSPDDSDDMPAEIVSPPMPLPEAVKKLNEFFAWAIENDAYANKSTGFHMGLSMPGQSEGSIDFVKLALFLGDEYVLDKFGRSANGYAVAAMKKIKDHINSRSKNDGSGKNEYAVELMGLMKDHLTSIAKNFIPQGFGKYTSINVKPNYIEFRSAGGPNYFKDIPNLEMTMLRYAQALAIASDPQAERKEYAKKLYKLLSPKSGDAALDLFARLAAGTISKEEFKKLWAKQVSTTQTDDVKGDWRVYSRETGKQLPDYAYNDMTKNNAMAMVKQVVMPHESWESFVNFFNKNYELRDASGVAKKPQHSSRRADLAKRILSKPTAGKFEIYDRATGKAMQSLNSTDKQAAWAEAQKWCEDRNMTPGQMSDLSVREVG